MEALRGALALWVLASHVLQSVGVRAEANPVTRLVNMGGLAVDGFVILSGFVITLTLARRPQRWLPFIMRRYFRLMPALVVATALAVLVKGVTAGWGFALPDLAGLHVLLHLMLLHGMVPDGVLPNASHSLLDVAWSISLEWQFYLVAPALVAVLGPPRSSLRALCGIAVGTTILAHLIYAVAHFGGSPTFLPLRLSYFMIGILCATAYLAYPSPCAGAAGLGIGLFVLLLLAFSRQILVVPFALWLCAFAVAWLPRGTITGPVSRVLGAKPLQWLGAVSYSLYVVHQPLVTAFGWWSRESSVNLWLAQVPAVVVSLLAAEALHRWVEKPGIAIGQRIAGITTSRAARATS